jgi:hypothetical protein
LPNYLTKDFVGSFCGPSGAVVRHGLGVRRTSYGRTMRDTPIKVSAQLIGERHAAAIK